MPVDRVVVSGRDVVEGAGIGRAVLGGLIESTIDEAVVVPYSATAS